MVREKEGAKKRREVLSHRGAIPGDFGEGGSTVNDAAQLKQVQRILI
jgi:hypothetical protein